MTQLLRSFIAGVGSILIFPQPKATGISPDSVEAIGGDFAQVGRDISAAMDKKRSSIIVVKEGSMHAEGKAEQLDLIPG